MHPDFRAYAEALHPKFEALIGMAPVSAGNLPKIMPSRGVYLFSEGDDHLYVGRTNRLRQRYGDHCRPSSDHNSAPFAFKLARIETGFIEKSYKAGATSRKGLSLNETFIVSFTTAKARVRAMDFRFVEEIDPTAQCLLEIYCTVALRTRHNDLKTLE